MYVPNLFKRTFCTLNALVSKNKAEPLNALRRYRDSVILHRWFMLGLRSEDFAGQALRRLVDFLLDAEVDLDDI